jgi:hypothetical protein
MWAVRRVAAKASHVQFQTHRDAMPWQISRTAHVPRRDALAAASTLWAARLTRSCAHHCRNGLVLSEQAHYFELLGIGQDGGTRQAS